MGASHSMRRLPFAAARVGSRMPRGDVPSMVTAELLSRGNDMLAASAHGENPAIGQTAALSGGGGGGSSEGVAASPAAFNVELAVKSDDAPYRLTPDDAMAYAVKFIATLQGYDGFSGRMRTAVYNGVERAALGFAPYGAKHVPASSKSTAHVDAASRKKKTRAAMLAMATGSPMHSSAPLGLDVTGMLGVDTKGAQLAARAVYEGPLSGPTPAEDMCETVDAASSHATLCRVLAHVRKNVALSMHASAVLAALYRILMQPSVRKLGPVEGGMAYRVLGGSEADSIVLSVIGGLRSGATGAVFLPISRVTSPIAKAVAVHAHVTPLTPHVARHLGYMSAVVSVGDKEVSGVGAIASEYVPPWTLHPGAPCATLLDVAARVLENPLDAGWAGGGSWQAWWKFVVAQLVWTAAAFRQGLGRGGHNNMHGGNVLLTDWPMGTAMRYALKAADGEAVVRELYEPMRVPRVVVINADAATGDVLDNTFAVDADEGTSLYDICLAMRECVMVTCEETLRKAYSGDYTREQVTAIEAFVFGGFHAVHELLWTDDKGAVTADSYIQMRSWFSGINDASLKDANVTRHVLAAAAATGVLRRHLLAVLLAALRWLPAESAKAAVSYTLDATMVGTAELAKELVPKADTFLSAAATFYIDK